MVAHDAAIKMRIFSESGVSTGTLWSVSCKKVLLIVPTMIKEERLIDKNSQYTEPSLSILPFTVRQPTIQAFDRGQHKQYQVKVSSLTIYKKNYYIYDIK